MNKGFVDGPTLPMPRLLLLLALILALGVTGAYAEERPATVRNLVFAPMGVTEGPDPVEKTVSCMSDGTIEITVGEDDIPSPGDIVELEALCPGVIVDDIGPFNNGLDDGSVVLDDGAPFEHGACTDHVGCAAHATAMCLLRGGVSSSGLVADVASLATGNACSITCGNGQRIYTICISQRPR